MRRLAVFAGASLLLVAGAAAMRAPQAETR